MIDAILEYGILKIIYEHDWKQIKNENTGGKSMEHVQLTAIDKKRNIFRKGLSSAETVDCCKSY